MKTILIALLLLLTTGCQAMLYGTGADFDKIAVGMDKPQVVAALGTPRSTSKNGDRDEEQLMYSKMARVLGWSPTSYQVLLRHGKVVNYGESANQ
jgi:hypothetical protein